MFESINTGMTAMAAFSRGLANISSNVANMNTVGFKRSVLQFRDLLYGEDGMGGMPGRGVATGQPRQVLSQGELRSTGNALDAALDGNGYFILRHGSQASQARYTRDGQFEFDAAGMLVARGANVPVMVMGQGGAPAALNIAGWRSIPGSATSVMKFTGSLSTADSDKLHSIDNITLFDALGGPHTVSIRFADKTDPAAGGGGHDWDFTLTDSQQRQLASGTLVFGADGAPAAGSDKFSFSWTPPGTLARNVTLDFGEAGRFSGLTSFSVGADSTASLQSADGVSSGSITGTRFEADGTVLAQYSNGQSRSMGRLALAWFANQEHMVTAGDNLWMSVGGAEPVIGTAQGGVFGSVSGAQVEGSNVDLTEQFSELILTQRGYQASSQVISTANDMLQQLFDMRGRR
ncbi:flagellar hook protein FlgE [Lacisediminimonas profundi]|uniref:flagellar hook protein FlgE n=1 Tax=Lacisediminimonas profundi TaxID=2603856 RepID=UPI001386A5BF|nr:flagellar hook-basal body complex protein [Lacisediminimonas profundi]